MTPSISDIGFGFGSIAVGFLVYLIFLVISLWIFYLVVRAAVASGVMRAARRGAFRDMNPPQYMPLQGGQAPMQGGPGPQQGQFPQ